MSSCEVSRNIILHSQIAELLHTERKRHAYEKSEGAFEIAQMHILARTLAI